MSVNPGVVSGKRDSWGRLTDASREIKNGVEKKYWDWLESHRAVPLLLNTPISNNIPIVEAKNYYYVEDGQNATYRLDFEAPTFISKADDTVDVLHLGYVILANNTVDVAPGSGSPVAYGVGGDEFVLNTPDRNGMVSPPTLFEVLVMENDATTNNYRITAVKIR